MRQQHEAAFPGWGVLLESDAIVPELRVLLRKHPELRFKPGGWTAVSFLFRLGDVQRARTELAHLLDAVIDDGLYAEILQSVSEYV